MSLRTPQAAPEQREDTSLYTKGVYIFELRHHVRKSVTFDAYIRGLGIVTITNDTVDNDFKMKVGNSLKLISDEPLIFLSEDDFNKFNIPKQQGRNRKPESLKPEAETPVIQMAEEFSADITGVYNK